MNPSAGPSRSASTGVSPNSPFHGDVDQRHGVARGRRRLLGAAHRAPEERMGDVRHDEADRAGGAGPQPARGHVGAVAELLGRPPHRLLGARRDAPARLPGQHERHGRLRHPGRAGDVDARDSFLPPLDGPAVCQPFPPERPAATRGPRRGGDRPEGARPRDPPAARQRGAARRGGLRARGVPALLGGAVAERRRARAPDRLARPARRAHAGARLRARAAEHGRRARRRPRAGHRLVARRDPARA